VIVTSRRNLAGLDDAEAIALETLSPAESIALFHAVANRNDIRPDDHALEELVELCGFLPLTIRIVAAWMSRRKATSAADVLAELRSESGPLARLADMAPKLIAVFEVSVRHLLGPHQDVFHRLGLVPGPDFDPDAVASLAGIPVDAAQPGDAVRSQPAHPAGIRPVPVPRPSAHVCADRDGTGRRAGIARSPA
jgi:hypothetical protein